MRPHDLPVSPSHGTVLWCKVCRGTFSALRQDYFARDPEAHLRCCHSNLVLATVREVVTPL